MKKNIIRICLLALVAITALSLISAKDPAYTDDGTPASEYVEWSLSEDGMTVKGDERIYTYYELPILSERISNYTYAYANQVAVKVGKNEIMDFVFSYERDGEVIWLSYYGGFYVTEEGRAHLDSFYSGEKQSYRVAKYYGEEAPLPNDFVKKISEYDGKRVTFNLPTLDRYNEYVIEACDTKHILSYPVASVFEIGGDLYYVDHSTLENNQFDADGNISFRKGSIELIKLEGDLLTKMRVYINKMEYIPNTMKFEREIEIDDGNYKELGISAIVWSGMICPVGGIAVGCILPNVKRLGKPKRWYAVAVLSGIALVLSVILLLIQ